MKPVPKPIPKKNNLSSNRFLSFASLPVSGALYGVVQGLTEFLPLSSSFHLSLVGAAFPAQKLAVGKRDASVNFLAAILHFASLLAVVLVFWKQLASLFRPLVSALWGLGSVRGFAELVFFKILLVTLPVLLVGFLFRRVFAKLNQNSLLNTIAFFVFGILLWISFIMNKQVLELSSISFGTWLFIGCLQILALFQGVSRLGLLLTTLNFLNVGFGDEQALLFCIFASLPLVLAVFGLSSLEWFQHLSLGKQTVAQHHATRYLDDLRFYIFAFLACLLVSILVLFFIQRAFASSMFIYLICFYRCGLGLLLLCKRPRDSKP